jgi:phosphomannomutase/phosphoglucomutase
MDRNPDMPISDLRRALPRTWATPTMSPFYADTENYDALARLVIKLEAKHAAGDTLGGKAIKEPVTVNGARVILEDGGWGLIRASSNTPNLVVVGESPVSKEAMRDISTDLDAIIKTEGSVGEHDRKI